MAILPILLIMIHSVLVSTTNAVHFVEKESESCQVSRALRNVLLEDLSACCLPKAKRAGTTEKRKTHRKLFLGIHKKKDKYDCLSFITRRPSRAPNGGVSIDLNEVGYEIRPNRNDRRCLELVRREQLLYDNLPTKGGADSVLYDRVLSFKLSYFDGINWVEDWDSEKRKDVPVLVKVDLLILVGKGDEEEECRIDVIVPLAASQLEILPADLLEGK